MLEPKMKTVLLLLVVVTASMVTSTPAPTTLSTSKVPVTFNINLKKPVHVVSDRFLSLTIDPETIFHTAECEISNATVNMARGLVPAYFRIGGPNSNKYTFKMSTEQREHGLRNNSKDFILTGGQLSSLYSFINGTGLDMIMCVKGGVQKGQSNWNLNDALDVITFSDKLGFDLGWQLGYEVQRVGNDRGKDLGQDIARLRRVLEAFPRYDNSPIIGPDMVSFEKKEDAAFIRSYLLEASDALNAFTWHPDFSNLKEDDDPTTMLSRTMTLLDNYVWFKEGFGKPLPKGAITKKPIWIGESDNKSKESTFTDAMMWLRKLGTAAKLGVSVYMRQPHQLSLFEPTPEFWVALLHKALVGRNVLDIRPVTGNNTKLHIFSHCSQIWENPEEGVIDPSLHYDRGAITIFGVNSGNEKASMLFKVGYKMDEIVHQYILTESRSQNDYSTPKILLNGQQLTLSKENELPMFSPKIKSSAKSVTVPPRSVFFFVLPETKCKVCSTEPSEDPVERLKNKANSATANVEESGEESRTENSEDIEEEETDTDAVYVMFPKRNRSNRTSTHGHKPASQTHKPSHMPGEHGRKTASSVPAPGSPKISVRFGDNIRTEEKVGDVEPIVKYVTFTDDSWLASFPSTISETTGDNPRDTLKINDFAMERKDTPSSRLEKYRLLTHAILGKRNVSSAGSDPFKSSLESELQMPIQGNELRVKKSNKFKRSLDERTLQQNLEGQKKDISKDTDTNARISYSLENPLGRQFSRKQQAAYIIVPVVDLIEDEDYTGDYFDEENDESAFEQMLYHHRSNLDDDGNNNRRKKPVANPDIHVQNQLPVTKENESYDEVTVVKDANVVHVRMQEKTQSEKNNLVESEKLSIGDTTEKLGKTEKDTETVYTRSASINPDTKNGLNSNDILPISENVLRRRRDVAETSERKEVTSAVEEEPVADGTPDYNENNVEATYGTTKKTVEVTKDIKDNIVVSSSRNDANLNVTVYLEANRNEERIAKSDVGATTEDSREMFEIGGIEPEMTMSPPVTRGSEDSKLEATGLTPSPTVSTIAGDSNLGEKLQTENPPSDKLSPIDHNDEIDKDDSSSRGSRDTVDKLTTPAIQADLQKSKPLEEMSQKFRERKTEEKSVTEIKEDSRPALIVSPFARKRTQNLTKTKKEESSSGSAGSEGATSSTPAPQKLTQRKETENTGIEITQGAIEPIKSTTNRKEQILGVVREKLSKKVESADKKKEGSSSTSSPLSEKYQAKLKELEERYKNRLEEIKNRQAKRQQQQQSKTEKEDNKERRKRETTKDVSKASENLQSKLKSLQERRKEKKEEKKKRRKEAPIPRSKKHKRSIEDDTKNLKATIDDLWEKYQTRMKEIRERVQSRMSAMKQRSLQKSRKGGKPNSIQKNKREIPFDLDNNLVGVYSTKNEEKDYDYSTFADDMSKLLNNIIIPGSNSVNGGRFARSIRNELNVDDENIDKLNEIDDSDEDHEEESKLGRSYDLKKSLAKGKHGFKEANKIIIDSGLNEKESNPSLIGTVGDGVLKIIDVGGEVENGPSKNDVKSSEEKDSSEETEDSIPELKAGKEIVSYSFTTAEDFWNSVLTRVTSFFSYLGSLVNWY